MGLLLIFLLFVLLQCCRLVRHESVGAWCFTTTVALCCFVSLFTTVVKLPSELPVHNAKLHWCIPRLVI